MPIRSNVWRRLEPVLLPAAFGALLLGAWHLAVVVTGTRVVPSPGKVARGLEQLAERGVLFRYTVDSLRRVGIGFCVAVLLAVPTGLWMGLSWRAEATLSPLMQILRPISPIAWIPVAIVLFGIGDDAPVFLIMLASFFPIAAATAAAVRRIPPMYLDAGHNFGLSRVALLYRVVFPATLPDVLGALRIAMGIAWLVVVAAEMIAVDSGLGYLIIDSRNAGKRYDLVVAGMVMVGLVGLLLDLSFRQLERLRSLRWGFRTPD